MISADMSPLCETLFNEHRYHECTHLKQRGGSASSCLRAPLLAYMHNGICICISGYKWHYNKPSMGFMFLALTLTQSVDKVFHQGI